MGELRWILFGLGLLALAAIYAFSRYRMGRPGKGAARENERVEPSLDGDLSTAAEAAPVAETEPSVEPQAPPVPDKVVAIRLMARNGVGFPGDQLVLAMRGAGLRHGQFGIFHAHVKDAEQVLFSVANLVEPGSFDLASLADQRIPGVSLFLLLPGPDDAMGAFEQMIETARSLAGSLDGELLDEQGSSLSVQRERYIRDEIQQFVREYLTQPSAAGSGA